MPLLRPVLRGAIAAGGIDSDIPDGAEATFTLNSIVGDDFVDAVNGWLFPIDGKDWVDDEWSTELTHIPWKTKATISAPADGTPEATAIQAIDDDNFWYEAGGTAQVIPIQSFFQNINFSNLYFARHVAKVVDGNSVETTPPGVTDITLYNTARVIDSTYTDYFGSEVALPVAGTDYFVAKSGNDGNDGTSIAQAKLTMSGALAVSGSGDTVHILGGDYNESWVPDTGATYIGVGQVEYTPDTTWTMNIGTNAIIRHLILNASGQTFCMILGGGKTGFTMDKCKTYGACTYELFANNGIAMDVTNSALVCTYSTSMGYKGEVNYTGCYLNLNAGITVSTANVITAFDVQYNTINSPAASIIIYGNTVDIDFSFNNIKGIGTRLFSMTGVSAIDSMTLNRNVMNITATNDIEFMNAGANAVFNDLTFTYNDITVSTTDEIFLLNADDCKDFIASNNVINIVSSNGANQAVLLAKSTQASSTFAVANNTINYTHNLGYVIAVGNESTDADDDKYTSISITGNRITKTAGVLNLVHVIFVGHNLDPVISYNFVEGGTFGIVMKHSGGAYTANGATYNIFKNCEIAIHIKGVLDCPAIGNSMYFDTITDFRAFYVRNNVGGDSATGAILKNNIIETTGGNGFIYLYENTSEGGTTDIDYNDVYTDLVDIASVDGVGRTWAEWQSDGFGANSIVTDPEFTDVDNDDFTLDAGSDAIGAGETLAAAYDDGLDSTTTWGSASTLPVIVTKQQTAPWDMGAYIS